MTPIEDLPGLTRPLGGAFYLHGEDAFRKEQLVQGLVEAHLDPATRDFNLDPLRGTDVDAERLASVIATPPMMAEWRVVVVREVEGLATSKKAREALLEAVSSPPPGLALILSCTVPAGSKAKFYRELAKRARSVELEPLAPDDVPGWLMARARDEHGVEMDVEAAQALGGAIGASLGILARELEKLRDYVGERRHITLEDVEAVGTRLPAQDRWRWFDLVGERRLDEALSAVGVLLGQGESGVGLVIGLTTHFLRLGIAAERGPRALEASLPTHQRWLARPVGAQAKKWRPDEIDTALAGLLRVDRLLKASPHTDQHFLEEWLLEMLSWREAA